MVYLCESASFGGICFNALVVYLLRKQGICKELSRSRVLWVDEWAENMQGTEQSFGYRRL